MQDLGWEYKPGLGPPCSLTLAGPWVEGGLSGSFHCLPWRPQICTLVTHMHSEQRFPPQHTYCAMWPTRGDSASAGDQACRRGAWVPQGRHPGLPHSPPSYRALPVSRGCGAPRGGSLGVGGRRYTTCTRPCSASLAASPLSRGSMKNSSSCIRIRPACGQGGDGSEAQSTTDPGGRPQGGPKGRGSHLAELPASLGPHYPEPLLPPLCTSLSTSVTSPDPTATELLPPTMAAPTPQ